MARDYRNTLGYLELLARQQYENGQQAQANQISAERRAAEYAGVNQLLKGVGQQMERNRAGDVRMAGAKGVGAALDKGAVPEATGDTEIDAAAQEGFQGQRGKLVAAQSSQDAILARLLQTAELRRPHEAAMEQAAQERAAAAAQRIADKSEYEKERNRLQAERDKATELYHALLGNAAGVRAGAARTSAGAAAKNAGTREASEKAKVVGAGPGVTARPTKVRQPDGSQKIVPPNEQEVANDRARRAAAAAELGEELPPEQQISSPDNVPPTAGASSPEADEFRRRLRDRMLAK